MLKTALDTIQSINHRIQYWKRGLFLHQQLAHLHQGFFFTKKVTPIIGVFPSANFPQEKYFSPKQSIFPQEINFPYFHTK